MEHKIPQIAILDNNMLAALGLKQLLQTVMPVMQVSIFHDFSSFEAAGPDTFFHYFVAVSIAVSHRDFFLRWVHKTIVLTTAVDPSQQLSGFHCLNLNTSEEELVRNLLTLEQMGHKGGKNFPALPKIMSKKILSDREIEVLSEVAQGKINKEIAADLNISMTTVITHRKNIQEKLGLKTVSALTIYAVMHGYVDINKI